MIRSLYYVPGQPIQKDLPPDEFPELIQNQQGLLWVDFISEPPEICLPILESFGFHPLAIDDALQETHVPKLDDWGDYLYIVLNYMNVEPEWRCLGKPRWMSWISFWDKTILLPITIIQITAIDETWVACDRDERNVQEGPITSSIRSLIT